MRYTTTTSLLFVSHQSAYYLIQIVPMTYLPEMPPEHWIFPGVFVWDGLGDLESAFIQSCLLPFPWRTLSASFALCSLGNYLGKSLEARVSNKYCFIIGTILCLCVSLLFLWKSDFFPFLLLTLLQRLWLECSSPWLASPCASWAPSMSRSLGRRMQRRSYTNGIWD